jgi:hypothetical protein
MIIVLIFTSVNLDEISSVPYSPTAILEEDDWFSINLSKTENTAEVATEDKISDPLELLSRQINTTLPTLKADQYKGVKYFVFEPSGKKWFLLQKVLSGSKIYGKKILTVSDQPKLIEKPVIIINEEPDALYNYETNTLYFKKLEKLNSIFSNINSLYREATKEEMDTFFQMEIISVDQQFTTNKIGMLNRKNIALILETYNSYDADVKKNFILILIISICQKMGMVNILLIMIKILKTLFTLYKKDITQPWPLMRNV